jgi:pyridoxal phosphate enzyme (YggS family)
VLEAAACGQRAFGENYLQEGVDKIAAVAKALPARLEWHFIGPIQSNKTRPIAASFDWVHTVERLKIAQRLSEQRPPARPAEDLPAGEHQRRSQQERRAPEELPALARAVAALPNLRLRGLMAIPEPQENPELQRAAFARLRELARTSSRPASTLDTLSMGMSATCARRCSKARPSCASAAPSSAPVTTNKRHHENQHLSAAATWPPPSSPAWPARCAGRRYPRGRSERRRAGRLRTQYGVTTPRRSAPVSRRDVIVLAVKPQQMRDVALQPAVAAGCAAAGAVDRRRHPRRDLSRWLGGYGAIVRTMPNTPALIGHGHHRHGGDGRRRASSSGPPTASCARSARPCGWTTKTRSIR